MRLKYDPAALKRANEPKEFGRVAVLFGGDSTEREISLLSGNAVLAALKRGKVDAHAFDPRDKPLTMLLEERFDRVWIALHGPGGEDGTLQGALEYLGVPYTGSGVMGSAIGMDKLRTKRLAQASGVATAPFVVLTGPQDFDHAVEKLGLPMIVKPGSQGSSVGMSKVEKAADLPAAYAAAAKTDRIVFAESWIVGAEYTVSILQGRALPSIRIETPRSFYDYEAKYFRDDTKYHCPSGLSAPAEQHLEPRARHVRLRGRRRLGPRGFHDGCGWSPAAARVQHDSGHDGPQPRADGGARVRHGFRSTRLARARDELHAFTDLTERLKQ